MAIEDRRRPSKAVEGQVRMTFRQLG
jgi:hypothetical protein